MHKHEDGALPGSNGGEAPLSSCCGTKTFPPTRFAVRISHLIDERAAVNNGIRLNFRYM